MEKHNEKNICFLFGIRFIERMKLLLFLSKRFKQKIRVNKTKKRLLSCLEYSVNENECFCTSVDDDAQIFQTTDVKSITFKNLNKMIENDAALERIVGFKLINPIGNKGNIRKMTKKKVTIVTEPYSEHCNFEELVDFVQMIEPETIVPTANFEESTKCIAKYFR